MSFGNIKKWELIALGAAAAAAVALRVLEETGVLNIPRTAVLIFLMVFAAVFFLRRPALLAVDLIKKRKVDKDKLSGAAVDIVFALIAEGVFTAVLLMSS